MKNTENLPDGGRKTNLEHWNNERRQKLKLRFPQYMLVVTRNIRSIIQKHVERDMKFIEVGFSPGVHLLWVAQALKAQVSGVDFSKNGVEQGRQLFDSVGVEADFRCEDFFNTSFPEKSFDVVYSAGFIEHFDDPKPAVISHVRLAKSGGKIVILIPNYGGIYGKLQKYFHPENLALHNVQIMNCQNLLNLAPVELVEGIKSYPSGKFCSDLVNIQEKLASPVAKMIHLGVNFLGLIQPIQINYLSPLLVLEMVRK